MYYQTSYPSPIGAMTLASDGENLVGLWNEGQKYHGGTIRDEMLCNDTLPLFSLVRQWLDRYFAGDMPAIADIPLRPIGGAFRQAVWAALCQISYGQTATYGDIARGVAAQMGRGSMSSQAVGGAVGHNPISIIIPCHRVVGTNGSLTGYAGGIAAKTKLLTLEGVDMSRFHCPTRGTAL